MNDTVLECFNVWKQRICIGRKEWDEAEKDYHRVCCESRALRGRKIKVLISDVKRREREFLKIDLNTLLTQELWSSTATMIVRATNDGFISSINKWQTMLHHLNNYYNNNNDLSINDDVILQTELMIDQWETIIKEIDTEAGNIAEEVKARQKNDKIKVRKLDRLQDTRKHFERKEKENRSNKRRKLSQPIEFTSSVSSIGLSSNNHNANRRRHRPHRRSRKEVGAIHARNECLAAMELHEAMRTVLSTLKIQQSNLLVCRAANRALGSCCEKLRSQQRRLAHEQLRLIVGRNNNNDNDNDNDNDNENENNNNNEDDDIYDDNNRNNMDQNEDTTNNNGANININNDAEDQQQNIDKEWNRKVEAVKVDSLYRWYRNNVGLL